MIVKKSFIFIRHGETEGNTNNLCQGRIDFPLTEKGRSQAYEAAERIKPYKPFSRVYSSNLKRAKESALIISSEVDCPDILYLEGLQERGWGVLEGSSNVQMFEREELELSPNQKLLPHIEGLEEKSDFQKRIAKTINYILNDSNDPVSLIVGHGRFFFSLCELLYLPPVKQVPNGTPVLCEYKGRWNIHAGESL